MSEIVLAIDTATPAGSVAVEEGGNILSLRAFDAPREHSRRLFVEIDAALADAGRERSQIRLIAATTGPGSFTGLRIGLSAAKGLCMGLQVPLVQISTLESLAARLPFCRLPVCTLLDARRGEVYAAMYETADGPPKQIHAPCADELGRLLALWGADDVLFTGDCVDMLGELLSSAQTPIFAPPSVRRPSADAVAWLASLKTASACVDVAQAEPVYLRTPSFVTTEAMRGSV